MFCFLMHCDLFQTSFIFQRSTMSELTQSIVLSMGDENDDSNNDDKKNSGPSAPTVPSKTQPIIDDQRVYELFVCIKDRAQDCCVCGGEFKRGQIGLGYRRTASGDSDGITTTSTKVDQSLSLQSIRHHNVGCLSLGHHWIDQMLAIIDQDPYKVVGFTFIPIELRSDVGQLDQGFQS
jgi:hypothetical protein